MKTLSPLLWDDHIEFEKWLEIQEIHIFTLHSWPAKIVTGFITSAALITIITLGLPLKSGIHLVVAYTFFFFLSMFCGQCLFISIGLLLKLKEIVDRPIKVPFFLLPHPGISRLQNFYSATTLIIVSFYTGFVIAVWLGPYGFNLAMLVWLTALSGYPLAMFSWSFFQIHFLLQNVKQSHLKIANNEVQQALKNVLTDHSLKETDRLEKMMSIQNKVKAMKEWPIAVEGALTFLTALVVAIVQALIYVLEVITDAKP